MNKRRFLALAMSLAAVLPVTAVAQEPDGKLDGGARKSSF